MLVVRYYAIFGCCVLMASVLAPTLDYEFNILLYCYVVLRYDPYVGNTTTQ